MIAVERVYKTEIKKEQVTPTKESLLQILNEFNYSTIEEILVHADFDKTALTTVLHELENQGELIVIGNKIITITTLFATTMAFLFFAAIAILPIILK
ncbi:hypothetical protein P4U97_01215 [Bacillus swezeyi]|uniref:hypothetical protein n=1 Tax=Bacillus swezeyi TaxID=1925020 RepID=UPI002E1FFFCF|nr:hypothetical protein [Bacillus swezeyi]